MTTSEIIQFVRDKALEDGAGIITDAKITSYADLAQKDIIKQSFPASEIASATIVCASGVCTLPSDFGTLYGSPKDATGTFYEEVSIDEYLQTELDNFVTVEAGALKVSNTALTSLPIKYWPKTLTLSVNQPPVVDDYLHELIIYGALYRVHQDLQDEDRATYYRTLFKDELKERVAVMSQYEKTNQRGAVMFKGVDLLM